MSRKLSLMAGTAVGSAALVFLFFGEARTAVLVGLIEGLAALLVLYFWPSVPAEGGIYWFTGLSGSGKSTLSDALVERLKRRGVLVESIDGDSVRSIFPGTGFTREERDQHLRRIGFLASKLEKNGVTVVASFVSPYRESRDFVRSLCKRFIEIHVSTPLEECEKRDVKGLYAKARRGEIKNFTGIDDPYEAPTRAEVTVDTSRLSIEQSLDEIFRVWRP